MAKQVSFKVTQRETEIIKQIADRAVALGEQHGSPVDRLSVTMDITATHANGCPLRLLALLDADDFNFSHDIIGIERHLDRDTGQLGDFFVPRFAKPAAPAEVA